jgi:hypothetical protein
MRFRPGRQPPGVVESRSAAGHVLMTAGSLQRPVPFSRAQLQVLRLRSVAALPHSAQDDNFTE